MTGDFIIADCWCAESPWFNFSLVRLLNWKCNIPMNDPVCPSVVQSVDWSVIISRELHFHAPIGALANYTFFIFRSVWLSADADAGRHLPSHAQYNPGLVKSKNVIRMDGSFPTLEVKKVSSISKALSVITFLVKRNFYIMEH